MEAKSLPTQEQAIAYLRHEARNLASSLSKTAALTDSAINVFVGLAVGIAGKLIFDLDIVTTSQNAIVGTTAASLWRGIRQGARYERIKKYK